MQQIENIPVLEQIREVAQYLWEKGWAERNAGNISINLTAEIKAMGIDSRQFPFVEDDRMLSDLAGNSFFFTGSGLRLRDLARGEDGLERNGCVLTVSADGKGYHIIWGGKDREDIKPTSEIRSHLNIHLDLLRRNSDHRVVLHTHAIELLALTHSKEHCKDSAQISKLLWSMLPEVRAFVPRGIALLPYRLPSSDALAKLTVEALREHDVALWSKHGVIATGADMLQTFDFIDVANKGAIIVLMCLSAGYAPVGMTDEEMQELVVAFNL